MCESHSPSAKAALTEINDQLRDSGRDTLFKLCFIKTGGVTVWSERSLGFSQVSLLSLKRCDFLFQAE